MTAQEWLDWWGSFDEWPESGSIAADNFYITAIENADAIIRAQHERIEMLERAVESVLDVVSDDYFPTMGKCPEYGKLVRNCRDHWRKWLMEGE